MNQKEFLGIHTPIQQLDTCMNQSELLIPKGLEYGLTVEDQNRNNLGLYDFRPFLSLKIVTVVLVSQYTVIH